jgi:hypothetical protein
VRHPFEYALLRAVPRADRDECVNVGLVLYCQAQNYLGCAVHLDPVRLRLLDPAVDLQAVDDVLAGIRAVCAGDPQAGAAGSDPPRARFGWLTAPRSTVVRPGPVHTGMTADPQAELQRLLDRLVRLPDPAPRPRPAP